MFYYEMETLICQLKLILLKEMICSKQTICLIDQKVRESAVTLVSAV